MRGIYSWLDLPQLGFLKTRAAYQEHVYPKRIDRILGTMSEHKPEVVVMYGMNNIDRLKKSVKTFYPGTKFQNGESGKASNPPASSSRPSRHYFIDYHTDPAVEAQPD